MQEINRSRENIITSIVVIRAIVVNDNDEILLIQRSDQNRTSVGEWELPGGKLEKGELLDQVMQREVKQETGLRIPIPETGVSHVSSSLITKLPEYKGITLITITKAVRIDGHPEVTLSHEHDNYSWVTWDEAIKMNLRDEVRDALNCPDLLI